MREYKTKVVFDQDSAKHYAFVHGHAPRGEGSWSFSLGRGGAWTSFAYHGTYGFAKKMAMAEARGIGCDTVTVKT